jgi:hypothetical protein
VDSRSTGLLIVVAGVALVLVGAGVWAGGFGWFGRLPGDLRIERGATRVYVPITSMLLVSVLLSGLLHLVRRFF